MVWITNKIRKLRLEGTIGPQAYQKRTRLCNKIIGLFSGMSPKDGAIMSMN